MLATFLLGVSMLGSQVQKPPAAGDGARPSGGAAERVQAGAHPDEGVEAGMERLPAGTMLDVQLPQTLPMRMGEAIEGSLVYDVYAENRVVLPKGTVVLGRVVGLAADRSRRIQARLRGDFTPFVTPSVEFDRMRMGDGREVPMRTEVTEDGAATLQLTPPPPRKGGLVRQQFDAVVSAAKDRVHTVTGPDKRDRLVKLLYSQLPYHPQRIEKGTSWTTATVGATELETAGLAAVPAMAKDPAKDVGGDVGKGGEGSATWVLRANLGEAISSKAAHVGEPVRAEVAAPVLAEDGTVEVPQGAVLEGEVTQARAARRFGRAGVLRFDFRRLQMPGAEHAASVQASLNGIDAASSENLVLGSEGQVKPKPQDKVVVPLLLFALASRPLDRDGGDNGFGKNAVASNSLGVAGFLVGTAGGWRNVASGIGFYGTAISVYNRWIKRGQETSFRRGTRITVQTTPRRGAALGGGEGAAQTVGRP